MVAVFFLPDAITVYAFELLLTYYATSDMCALLLPFVVSAFFYLDGGNMLLSSGLFV